MAGPKGTTRAQVHSTFAARVDDLRNRLSKSVKDGMSREDQRKWYTPPEWDGVSLFDIENLSEGFNRDAINENYAECMKDGDAPGTNGDVMSLKQQCDYNAAEERALRLRHASVVRNIVHSCGRRRGHHHGRLYPEVLRQVTDLIRAGAV